MIGAAKNSINSVVAQGTRLTLQDYLLVVIITFPVFGTFFPLGSYLAGSVTNLSGAPVAVSRDTTVILAVILLAVLYLFAKSLPNSLISLRRNWLIVLFIAWALVTSAWAEVPSFSFNRSGRLLILVLYAIFVAELLQRPRASKLLFYSLTLSLIASLAIIIVYPPLASTGDGRGLAGTWRGAMSHKNSLGTLAGIGLIFSAVLFQSSLIKRSYCAALFLISFALIALANSVTALLASFLILGILSYLFYVVPLVKERVLAFFLAVVFVAAAGLVVYTAGSVLALFGRDSTLTGRSEVWEFARLMIDRKPIWGYGHGAWTGPVFSETAFAYLTWPCPHAHNFWIDVRLQLGLPGLFIAIAMWAIAVKNALYVLLTRSIGDFAIPLAVLVLLGIRSYSETIIVDPALGDSFWFAFAFASLGKLASDERRRRRNRLFAHENIAPSALSIGRRFGAELGSAGR